MKYFLLCLCLLAVLFMPCLGATPAYAKPAPPPPVCPPNASGMSAGLAMNSGRVGVNNIPVCPPVSVKYTIRLTWTPTPGYVNPAVTITTQSGVIKGSFTIANTDGTLSYQYNGATLNREEVIKVGVSVACDTAKGYTGTAGVYSYSFQAKTGGLSQKLAPPSGCVYPFSIDLTISPQLGYIPGPVVCVTTPNYSSCGAWSWDNDTWQGRFFYNGTTLTADDIITVDMAIDCDQLNGFIGVPVDPARSFVAKNSPFKDTIIFSGCFSGLP
jgi:hypothetical protein